MEGHTAFYHQKYLTKQEKESIYQELGEYARQIH